MASKSTKNETNLSGTFGEPPTTWANTKSALADPELMQPTILSVSSTYILVTASIYLKLLAPMPQAIIFTYYCCILGLISCIIFYLRLLYMNDSSQTTVKTIHILVQCALVGLYIGHWFVPLAETKANPNWLQTPEGQSFLLYEPLHMVVKIVYIVCVLISLVASLVN